ncbi:methyltransferase [Salinimonas marina]|uniref:tRNA1(Val) (adenine(37)-N6)-methyltransferase n=1 Tax=Salinimonas marina TaxID=2785918 RepID=A0A7S9DYB6_9ALTE|nr:methyltransferase [Salinimonas marina]QPG06077.1 methyltransferase [Salinimonas marina]
MAKGFQCKQFFVGHEHCAMKVSTDALVLGSWAPVAQVHNALDIGCGSGILSLMLRQRLPDAATVTGLDVDAGAVRQSRDNVAGSPWPRGIHIKHCALHQFTSVHRYDLIICNPPYFSQAGVGQRTHLAQTKARQRARHDDALAPAELFSWVAEKLTPAGHCCCLYPATRFNEIVQLAARHHLRLQQALMLHHREGKPAHAVALQFSAVPAGGNDHVPEVAMADCVTPLYIRDSNNQYTAAYKSLCQPFYLAF